MKRLECSKKDCINYDLCVICQDLSDETVQKVTKDGYPALLTAALTSLDDISNLLRSEMLIEDDFLKRSPVYHARCRRNYTRKYYKSDEGNTISAQINMDKRSKTNVHTINKKFCFICQKDRDIKGNRKVILISTFSRQNEIWYKAKKLHDEHMLRKIEGFSDSCIDMIANDFKYHRICMTNYLNKVVNTNKVPTPKPTHHSTNFYPFDDLQDILFVQGKGVPMNWVRKKIQANASDSNVFYDSKYPRSSDIERVLRRKFGKKITVLTNGEGLPSFVFSVESVLQKMKKHIINVSGDNDSEETTDSDLEQKPACEFKSPHKTHANIFHTATIIRRDIMNQKTKIFETIDQKVIFSRNETIASIPPRLFNFIHFLLHDGEVEFDNDERALITKEAEEKKVISLCQDILFLCGIKTAKSIGLALLLLKQRQKFLIEVLNHLGHCVSYPDVQRYLHDAAVKVDESIDESGIFIPSNIQRNRFTQFALDNLDFQEKIKDGTTTHGTTHIIYQHDAEDLFSDEISLKHSKKRLGQRNLFVSERSLSKKDKERSRSLQGVNIAFYNETKNYAIGSIWNLYSMISNSDDEADDFHPLSWTTFYKRLSNTNDKKTVIGYGPFVPESPTNSSVVQNSLDYFLQAAKMLNQQHVIVTADQAIYEIILALKSKYPLKYDTIIPRMGGFHIIMNFLGAIGRLMSCSGLEDLLVSGRILLEGTAKKIVSSGKDYYQMVRCHGLIYAAMFDLYWESFETYVRCEDSFAESEYIETFNTLMDSIKHLRNSMNLDTEMTETFMSFSNSAALITEMEPLRLQFEQSFADNPTAKLWLMYMDMVAIVQWYIFSERNGNWEEHLSSVEKMLPYLVTAGHYKYVSYVPHYLQCMKQLKSNAPTMWEEFQKGKFTIHLTEGTFNGVWTDMALEQTYNKDCKTQLFSGISMQRETTDKYIYSLPVLTSLTDQFLKTFINSSSVKQSNSHSNSLLFTLKEMEARERVKNIIRQKINPFAFETKDLLNIYSGSKCSSTELSNAKSIGLNVLKMSEKDNNQKVPRVKIQLFSDTVKPVTSTEIKSKLYEDEAMVLRSMYLAIDFDDKKKLELFSHEWLNYPPSLSEPCFSGYTLRKGNKADFYNSIKLQMKNKWIEMKELNFVTDEKSAYIIDMMAFIQSHQYKSCKTFGELFRMYIDTIIANKPVVK